MAPRAHALPGDGVWTPEEWMGSVFRGNIEDTSRRPWPLPKGPWVMAQRWHDVLFAHWPVPEDALRPLIPPRLALDRYRDQTWLGIVSLHMTRVAPRGLPPVPWLSAFPALNVRTYVTAGGRPGVFFLSLDTSRGLAVAVGRALAGLPYFAASMDVSARDGWVRFTSRRRVRTDRPAAFRARYRPTGPAGTPAPGSLAHFLIERFCLYAGGAGGTLRRLEIHHPPWFVQPAEAVIDVNTMAEAAGVALPVRPPVLHYAARQDAWLWPPRRAG